MERAPLSPDEATMVGQLRLSIGLFSAAAIAFGLVEGATGSIFGSPRAQVGAILFLALGVWLAAFPRRALGHRPVASVIVEVAVAITGVVATAAFLQPYLSFVAATALLIPVAAALPYLEVRPLRRLMVFAWAGIVATAAAGFLPDDTVMPAVVKDLVRLWGLTMATGLVLFLLYQSSRRLGESGREFRQLFRLSSELAETTEPAVLGELVAHHLTDATGFDECLIYALDPDTELLAPFGSYPARRSLEVATEVLADRPMLGRVIHDRTRIAIDVSDARADPAERARLQASGRGAMLLLPLATRSGTVGVAELTAGEHRAVDERRLALARTLSFEAAMAIENGRLYQQLRHRSLHDALTGLANRVLFHDRVEHALDRRARVAEAIVAVLFVDLDGFKDVNDTLGHARGDRLLVLVAERLRTVVRPADTVCRLGGDEFALLLENLGSVDEAVAVAARTVEALAAPFQLADGHVTISASVGVATLSVDGVTGDALMHEADTAMYAAKKAGKGRAVRFQPGLAEPLRSTVR